MHQPGICAPTHTLCSLPPQSREANRNALGVCCHLSCLSISSRRVGPISNRAIMIASHKFTEHEQSLQKLIFQSKH